jgi:signal transduction histidine kinase
MMLFFLLGYLTNIVLYYFNTAISNQDLLIAFIFFFGAIFVFAMVAMVLRKFAAIKDIAERDKELIKAKEMAEQGNRAKNAFLSRMSHEMLTPMNSIVGMATLGKLSDEAPEKDDCFDKIETASGELLSAMNNILDMSEIEANKLQLVYSVFNVRELISAASDSYVQQYYGKNQHFSLEIAQNVPASIKSDKRRLHQVLANILSNAFKFTSEKGSISLTVSSPSLSANTCMIQFKTSDSGIGITESQQAMLFKPFEQADGSLSRKFVGSGLGLAISKQIVEMMNGEISIESVAGEGTRVTFYIIAEIAPPNHPA